MRLVSFALPWHFPLEVSIKLAGQSKVINVKNRIRRLSNELVGIAEVPIKISKKKEEEEEVSPTTPRGSKQANGGCWRHPKSAHNAFLVFRRHGMPAAQRLVGAACQEVRDGRGSHPIGLALTFLTFRLSSSFSSFGAD